MCKRWRADFAAFLADMGPRPAPEHSIDRIDNDRGYSCGKCDDCAARGEPSNCRWATRTEQARNKSTSRFIEFRGERMTLVAWAERVGVPMKTLHNRLNSLGWTVERALTEPVASEPWSGPARTTVELARRAGIRPGTLDARLRAGWSEERALVTPVRKRKDNAA